MESIDESPQENFSSERETNIKLKKFKFLKIGILLFTLLICWIVIEIVFYNINLNKNLEMQSKCGAVDQNILFNSMAYSLVQYSYQPSSQVRHCGPEWDYVYSIDQYGLRKTKINSENNRALAVGDSFTFGFGVHDDETFPALLDMNDAGIWSAPFDVQLNAFKRDVELFNPKTVVWSFYPSHIITMMPDAWNAKCPGDTAYLADNSPMSNLIRPIAQGLIVPLIRNTSIGNYFLNRANIIRFESDNKGIRTYKNCYETKEIILYDKNISNNSYTSYPEINKTFGPDRDAIYKNLEVYLKEAKVVADQKGIDMYFVIIPSRLNLKLKEESYKSPYKNSEIDADLPFNTFKNAIVSSGFNEDHIINLSEDFLKTGDWQKYYYQKDAHWNRFGHEFVSRVIRDRLFK